MPTPTRLEQIMGRPRAPYASSGEREGSRIKALRDAYLLDTSAGQLTMFSATARAFDVPIIPSMRRVQPGYTAYDDDLRGYELHLDEFVHSSSPEETRLIKQMIDNNLDLRRNLEDYGGMRFAAGLLDPINLIPVPFAIGRGFAEGAKVALKRGTPIIAGTELARHAIDPTSTWTETSLNTVGGMLFMGLIGGGVGMLPKDKLLVTDLLNKLTPPAGTTMAFGGVPFGMGGAKRAFGRVKRSLASAAGSGEPMWKTVDPDDMKLHVEKVEGVEAGGEFPSAHVTVTHKDGHVILNAFVRKGRLEIGVEVPAELRRQGLASYAIREAVQYAEKHGLKLASHGTVSKDAQFLWKALDKEGFNIHENPNVVKDPDGTLRPTDKEPVFEARPVVDPEAQQIPVEVREELTSLKADVDQAEMELRVFEEQVKVLKDKVKNAPVAGGAKTKAKKELEQALKDRNESDYILRRRKSTLQDRNVQVAQMLDEATIKDWDLLPTGYNTILGKIDQFPWWNLMKTPFRDLAPDLAVKYQMFALKMAATPGLNNKGNTMAASSGPSVEALSIEYTGKWLSAARTAQKIYRKYAGYGETSSQVKHFTVDLGQRVRSSVNRRMGGEKITHTADGKLTIDEFERQISVAIADGGRHSIPEVAEAASGYVKVLKEIGDEGKRLEVFATQQNLNRRIAKIEQRLAEFDEKWGEKFDVGDVRALDTAEDLQKLAEARAIIKQAKDEGELDEIISGLEAKWIQEGRDASGVGTDAVAGEFTFKSETGETFDLVQDAADLGIENPREYLALTKRVMMAEKPTNLVVKDPVTGEDFTALELMKQMESEGKAHPQSDEFATYEEMNEFSRRRGYTEEEIEEWNSWHQETVRYINNLNKMGENGTDEMAGFAYVIGKEVDAEKFAAARKLLDERTDILIARERKPLPPGLQAARDDMNLEKAQLEEMMEQYKLQENEDYIHVMWIAEEVIAQKAVLKEMIRDSFWKNPIEARTPGRKIDPDVLNARVDEAYASILHDAETGGDAAYAPNSTDQRDWLIARSERLKDNPDGLPEKHIKTQLKIIERKLARIANGEGITGGSGPLIARKLDLDNKQLIEMGLIEGNVNSWMNHYIMRTAPIIETARVFGDAKAQKYIDDLFMETYERAQLEKDPVKQKKMIEEGERAKRAMIELRDIVHGVWQIPDKPDAITPRLLRMLRNFNILGAMGRSVFMALGDTGNVIVSQGFTRSLGHAFESFAGGLNDGNIKMIKDEVDLAGATSEVILGMRYHQMTDFGAAVGYSSKAPAWFNKMERGLSNASQRFFLYNLLGPWTDMARRFSGGMLQSRIIEYSRLWKAGQLSKEDQTIMTRLGINKEQAIQFVDEWEASGGLKHKSMFIANTSQWMSENAVRTFRAAMNTEINRMVPTPGAVDKPKTLLKSEWWKVIGQYRGFSIAATHRIMGAGIHTKGKEKWAGMASMVGIAMMVDTFKRPDYIQMPLEEQVLRAVELSGVTGIILDLNDTIERASGGAMGLRPTLGMDIRERNPNWANRMGTIGAVPNQWLTLMYGLTSDDAETNDLARAIRYMIPYNNLLWWNEAFNRAQRASVDLIEDIQE